MVPNGHESTYIFFRSIIKLGLFEPRIGFLREVNIFLYHWPYDKSIKDKTRKKGGSELSKAVKKTKTSK